MNDTIIRHQIEQQHIETERELVDFVEIVYLSLSVCIGTLLNSMAVFRLVRYSKNPSANVKRRCLGRPLHMNSFAMFKFNLAITDFAILFIHALGKMVWLLSYRWLFGDFGCRLYQFLSAFAYYSNSNVVVAIGLDRLKVVYSGQVQCVFSSTHRVRILLIIAWLLAAICALPQLFFWTNFELGLGWSQCTTIWQIAEYSQASGLISNVNLTTLAADIHHQNHQQQKDFSWSAHANTQLLYELLHQVIVFIIPLISLSASYLLIVVRVLRYSLRPPLNSNLCSFNCADQWAAANDGQPRAGRRAQGEGPTGEDGQGWRRSIRISRRSAGSRNFLQRLHLLRQRGPADEHLLHPSSSTSFSRTIQQKVSTATNVTNCCYFGQSFSTQNNGTNGLNKNGDCLQCTAPPPSPNLFTINGQMNGNISNSAFETAFPYFTDENGKYTPNNNNDQPTIAESAADRLLLSAKKALTNAAQKEGTKFDGNKLSCNMELYNFPKFLHCRPKRGSLNLVMNNNSFVPQCPVAEEPHHSPYHEVTSSFCNSSASSAARLLLMPRGVVRPQMLPQAMPGDGISKCGGISARHHRTFFGGRHSSVAGESTNGGTAAAAPISPLWRRQMRSKVFIRSLLIVAAHCAFWLPYNLLNLLRFTNETTYIELVDRGALLVEDLIIMNSLINPMLYGYGK